VTTLILIVLLVGAVIGFCQGAFKQIANFLGVVVGVLVASLLSHQFGEFLVDRTGTSQGLAHTIAFFLIAIVVPIVIGWIATLLTKLFKKMHLGLVNRLCGAAIGAVCYGIVMSFAFNVMDFIESSGGFKQERLTEREPVFYTAKHASQVIVPDFLIVDDSTEVANLEPGVEPRRGLKPAFDDAVDSVNPFN